MRLKPVPNTMNLVLKIYSGSKVLEIIQCGNQMKYMLDRDKEEFLNPH